MESLFVEEELKTRIWQHKVCLTMAEIANRYIEEQNKGDIKIPVALLQRQAVGLANRAVAEYIAQGKLDEAYGEAWNKLKDKLPDNYSTLL